MTERPYTLLCPNCRDPVLKNLLSTGRNGDMCFRCETCGAFVELYWKDGKEVKDGNGTEKV